MKEIISSIDGPVELNMFEIDILHKSITCGKCKRLSIVRDLVGEEINTILGNKRGGWRGYKYNCPYCGKWLAKMTLG